MESNSFSVLTQLFQKYFRGSLTDSLTSMLAAKWMTACKEFSEKTLRRNLSYPNHLPPRFPISRPSDDRSGSHRVSPVQIHCDEALWRCDCQYSLPLL